MKRHSFLDYEYSISNRLNKSLPILNRITYNLQKAFGKKEFEGMQWKISYLATFSKPSIKFTNLDKKEVDIVKRTLKLNSLTKSINEYEVAFSCKLDNGIEVRFSFGLPSSCKVEKEVKWEDTRDADSYRWSNGKIQKKSEVVTKINCGEMSMMKAIFDDWTIGEEA